MCRLVLDVSESGFFVMERSRPASQRQRDDMIYLGGIFASPSSYRTEPTAARACFRDLVVRICP